MNVCLALTFQEPGADTRLPTVLGMTELAPNLRKRRLALLIAGVVAASLIAAGCGSSSDPTIAAPTAGGSSSATAPPAAATGGLAPPTKEVTPAGDIPDNQVYVAYAPPGAGFTVKVPEGWSRTSAGGATTFTDKLNAVRMELSPSERTATAASVTRAVLPQLAKTVPGYSAGKLTTVTRAAGSAVKVTYQATSAADPVTGKTHRSAVERYEFAKGGKVAVLTLSGPVGADNVDPWKIVTEAFRWAG